MKKKWRKRKINYSRPDLIRRYRKQVQFIDSKCRFCIIEANTKAGKTTGCIVWIYEEALKGKKGDVCWWVAPTFSVAEIAYRRMKRFIKPKKMFKTNESKLTITLINGVTIFFKGADKPDSLYGEDVIAAVLDEATRMKEESWTAVFSTLTATNGKCKIIGNVKGISNWVYPLARSAEKGEKPNWEYHRITADDAVAAGVLRQEVVDEARRTLPEGIFLELYYCIPFVNASNRFCYEFNEKKHVKSCTWNPEEYTYLSFDFNVNPITCTVIQWYDDTIKAVECIKLPNSNIYKLCDVIKLHYPDANFIVTGDASGKNTSTLQVDNLNNFDIIKTKLGLSQGQMKQLAYNPKLEDNQVLVNAILYSYNVEIDPNNASALIYDCKFVEMLPSGQIDKGTRSNPKKQSDALDTFRYFLNTFLRWYVKHLAYEESETN